MIKYFLHDASRLGCSLLGLALSAVETGRKKVGSCISSCLSNAGFVSREEFEVFSEIVKDVKLKQDRNDESSSFSEDNINSKE